MSQMRKILRHLSERRPKITRGRTQSWPYENLKLRKGSAPSYLATIPEGKYGNKVDENQNNLPWNVAPIKFQDTKICSLIKEILKSYLEQFDSYDHHLSSRLGEMLSDLIRSKVCALYGEYWKVVANVFIGAVSDHGLAVASQCLWVPECDKFASATFENNVLFAFGVVFAVSYEKEGNETTQQKQ